MDKRLSASSAKSKHHTSTWTEKWIQVISKPFQPWAWDAFAEKLGLVFGEALEVCAAPAELAPSAAADFVRALQRRRNRVIWLSLMVFIYIYWFLFLYTYSVSSFGTNNELVKHSHEPYLAHWHMLHWSAYVPWPQSMLPRTLCAHPWPILLPHPIDPAETQLGEGLAAIWDCRISGPCEGCLSHIRESGVSAPGQGLQKCPLLQGEINIFLSNIPLQ